MSDHGFPRCIVAEEALREGMQIESADISVDDKLRLLDALSRTGVHMLMVGSFVSPKWVPQMAHMDELMQRFEPRPGIIYTALALNQKGVEGRRQYADKLAPELRVGRTGVHLCDVFVQRNAARTQRQEIDSIPARVQHAVDQGFEEATISINAAWGSNWLGEFSHERRVGLLQLQYDAWTAAGIPVTRAWIGDPMSWNTPRPMERLLDHMMETWPSITEYTLHLHDARGMAMLTAYAALRRFSPEHTFILDTGLGGMGGCPYCGNGRMTRMVPTEDWVNLLHEEGIETGIDLDGLIECAWLAEEIVGHELWGRVSKAGPRPRGEQLYAMDMPFIETEAEAQHFRLGPQVYAGCRSPYAKPITSPDRDALGLARDRAAVSASGTAAGADSGTPTGTEGDRA